MNSLQTILNYQEIHARLATSGQPTQEQLVWIKQADFTTVINLALSSASNALVNEDQLVLDLGMQYIHLPMSWENPSLEQAKRVLGLLARSSHNKNQKIWLHCALNQRVSSLMYVFRVLFLKEAQEAALQKLQQIWTPDPTWQQMIEQLKLA